jgi:hypothetical protein
MKLKRIFFFFFCKVLFYIALFPFFSFSLFLRSLAFSLIKEQRKRKPLDFAKQRGFFFPIPLYLFALQRGKKGYRGALEKKRSFFSQRARGIGTRKK